MTQYIVKGLLPDKDYAISFKVKDGEEESDWSIAYDFHTITNNASPATPGNTSFNFQSSSAVAYWDSVTKDTNNKNIEITRYEVQFRKNSSDANPKQVTVSPSSNTRMQYEVTFEQNVGWWSSPVKTLEFRVRGYGNNKQFSAWTSWLPASSATLNPPTNLTYTLGANSIALSWTAPVDYQVVKYNVYMGTSSSFASQSLLGDTTTPNFIVITDNIPKYFTIKAVDRFGNESTGLSNNVAITAEDPFAVDVAPPANPTGVSVSTAYSTENRESTLTVSWSAQSDEDLQNFIVRIGPSVSGPWNYTVIAKKETSVTLPVSSGRVYHVQVSAVDFSGNASDWVVASGSPITSAKDTTAPAQVTGLSVTQQGSSFIITWNALTDVDLDSYEISVTNGANERFFYPGKDNRFELTYAVNKNAFGTAVNSGDFKVRGKDTTGNNGTYSTVVTSSFGTPAAPTNLTNTPGANSVKIGWTASTTVSVIGYNIYRDTTANPTTKIAEVRGTSFTDTVAAGNYYYSVKAFNEFGTESAALTGGPFTATNPFLVDSTAPAVPGSLAATITNNPNGQGAFASLTWTNGGESDRAGIEISYKRNSDSVWSSEIFGKDATSGIIDLNYPYTAYDFRIRAFDSSANYSAWSSTLAKPAVPAGTPAVPTGFVSTPSKDSIVYSWNAVADTDIKNYEVQFSTSSTFASGNIQYLTGTATTLTVAGLNPTTTYYARVRATNQNNISSAYTATDTETTGTFPLSDGSAPSSSPTPTVTSGLGYLYATWPPVTNADPVTYEVHLSATSGFTPAAGTKVTEVSGTFALIDVLPGTTNPLVYDTTYYVKLIAKDRDGAAAAGNQGSAAPQRLTPGDSITGSGNSKTFHDVLNYDYRQGNAPGSILIQTPITFSANMVRVTIEGYNYLTGETDINTVVGFYAYNTTNWYLQHSQTNYGSKRINVRLFSKDADNTVAIVIDSVVGNWQYPSIRVSKVEFGYSVAPDSWATSGWTANLVTDLTGYTQRVVPPVQDLADTHNRTNDWTFTGTTEIDGGSIRADTIDVIRLKANSTFTQNLNVKSTFTLGDSGTPGIIKSYNHDTTNKTGFSLSSAGLEIWQGKVSAAVLEAGTTITQNLGVTGTLTVSAAGAIQSSNYSGTAGYKISNGGIELNDSNSTVKAEAIKAGTLGGSGGSGVINIAAGSSLVLNGGYLKSNTYTGTSYNAGATAGFYLGNDGLVIAQGAVKASTLTTGDISSASLTLSGTGEIKTVGYDGTSGFRLSSSGLEVPDGSISGAKLSIGSVGGNNLWTNSSFEKDTNGSGGGYFDGWNVYSNDSISSASRVSGRTSGYAARIMWTTAGNGSPQGLYRPIPGGFKTGTWYSLSWWAKTAGTAVGKNFSIHHNAPSPSNVTWRSNPATTTGWQRYAVSFLRTDTTDSIFWGLVGVGAAAAANTNYIDFDDIQIEESEFPSAYSPQANENLLGYTIIDGGTIKTGQIRSTSSTASRVWDGTANAWVNSSQPTWSIDTQGNAVFYHAQIRGDLVIGNSGDPVTAQGIVRSQNWAYTNATTFTGWAIEGNGDSFFNNITAKGTILATAGDISGNLSITGTGKIILSNTAGATSGARINIAANKIEGFNSGGTSTFTLDGTNGDFTAGGLTVNNTGMTLASGSLTLSGTGNINVNGGNITVSSGYIRGGGMSTSVTSSASASGNGFILDQNGLYIGGTGSRILANVLQTQSGSNMMPGQYSSFELPSTYYPTTVTAGNGATGSASVSTTQKYNGTQSLRLLQNTTTTANGYIEYRATPSIVVVPGKTYIVSMYVYQEAGTASDTTVMAVIDGGASGGTYRAPTGGSGGNQTITTINAWVRYSWTFVAGSSETAVKIYPRLTDPSTATRSNRLFYFDAIQVEEQTGGLTTPSTYVLNGITEVDGGMIKTGSIRSQNTTQAQVWNGTTNAWETVSQPAWIIDTGGTATFYRAQVRGNLTVGQSGDAVTAQGAVSSANYSSGSAGWIIEGNGDAEFNSVTVRGTIHAQSGSFAGNISSSAKITGGTFETASSGERIVVRNDGSGGIIEAWSGATGEDFAGVIDPTPINGASALVIRSGSSSTYNYRPLITVNASNVARTTTTTAGAEGGSITINSSNLYVNSKVVNGITSTSSWYDTGVITHAAAADLNLYSNGGAVNIDGETGVEITPTTGRITLNKATRIGANGTNMTHFAQGKTTVALDANGQATINHGMSTAPTSVVCMVETTNINYVVLQGTATANFTIKVYNSSGAAVASANRTIHWFATS